ncbi:MAG: molybdopterin converting factor subunit 1 [Aquificae bacterium]|nr:molybdopterin converting factor subunit 1 [Aquificota bacterium]
MVKVLYFSVLREKVGKREEEIEFSGSVRELRELLVQKYPEAASIIRSVRIAVNEEYAKEEQRVSEGDRIALIPPVSGG